MQLAKDYIADGYEVTVCGRNKAVLDHLYEDNAEILTFDTTNTEQTRTALNSAETPDIVILNAGTCEYIDDIRALDEKLFHKVIDINLNGTVNCLAALLPKLKSGAIIAIMSSSVTYLPFSRAQAYGASKAALDYLAKSLAIDLQSSNISVSLIRPGFVETPLTDKNDFAMPGKITTADASRYIRNGIAKRKKEINFPPLFISIMKLFAALPSAIWFRMATAMSRQS